MNLRNQDKVAIVVSPLAGTIFGYLTLLAGFGGVFVAGVYGVLIVPLIIAFVADRRKLLVWQLCVVPFALYISALNPFAPVAFLLFWTLGSVLSSPVLAYLYWGRSKDQVGQLAWLLLGPVFVGLICLVLVQDPFLFVGLSIFWIAACLGRFAWHSRTTVGSRSQRAPKLIALGVLLFAIGAATSISLLRKQETFRAAMDNHYHGIARLFVRMGADPNLPDGLGNSALVAATWNGVGDLDGVNALIAMGANVNQTQSGAFQGLMSSGTALHVAASAGREDICVALLEAGAATDARSTTGQTPLLAALSRGTIGCIPALLEYGANVNSTDGQGKTALMMLMNFGPDDRRIQNILQTMLARGAALNAKDADGKSAADWAVYYKHERFKELLRSFPDQPVNVAPETSDLK